MFLLGLVIWAGVISFLIQLPLASVLNTEDYLPASMTVWIKYLISFVALFAAAFTASKRYILPASISRLAIWIAVINLVLSLLNLLVTPLLLGSKNVLAFVSTQSIVTLIVNAVLAGGATYLALRLFSQSSPPSTTQV